MRKVLWILGIGMLLVIGAVAVLAILIQQENPDLAMQSLDEIQFDIKPPAPSLSNQPESPQATVAEREPGSDSESGSKPELPTGGQEREAAQQEPENQIPDPFEYEGMLKLMADGKLFGEEQFRLTRTSSGDYRLISSGYFQFKVVLVNTKFRFQQALSWTEDLNPEQLAFKLEGPLGVGSREFDISFSSEDPYRTASIHTGKVREDVRLPSGELAVQGTFSTFAMLPHIMGDRDTAEVQMIIANGFGPNNTPGATSNEISLARLGEAVVRDGIRDLVVEEFELGSAEAEDETAGTLRILFANGELIGIYAKAENDRADGFQVFRSDIFPDGFEIESYN